MDRHCTFKAKYFIFQNKLVSKGQDLKKYKALTALQSHLKEREEMGKTQVVKESVIPMVQQYKIQVRITFSCLEAIF